jgi:endonuclease-3
MTAILDATKALDQLKPYMEGLMGHPYSGFTPTTPFKALIGTMLSLRARGVVVGRVERELFAHVNGPQDIVNMSSEELVGHLRPLGHGARREQFIRGTCEKIIRDHGGQVPSTLEELLALPGVGHKTANLTLDAGFGQTTITVDTHVHRIMNIWGYVETKNADATEAELYTKLPKRYWKWFNPLLVDFGNQVCWPASPKCSICPLADICPKIGVLISR